MENSYIIGLCMSLGKTLLTIGKPAFSKAFAELFLGHPNNSEGGALCFYIHKKEKGKFVLYFPEYETLYCSPLFF